MKKIIFYAPLFALGVTVMSCGTGKKLKAAEADIQKLNGEITQLHSKTAEYESKAAEYEKQVAQLKNENLAYGREMQGCRELKESILKRNEDFKQALAEEGTSMEKIEKKFEDGYAKFEKAGAEVSYKEGLLHVSLSDKLLFAKGSSKIGAEGTEALAVVAEVMNENPKIQLYVVGNTDTTHVRGIADNWSLSTERANTIVRILRDKYHVNPANLIAAGRGKYNPVADNSTEEGRAKNRRIDLIINANLAKLWDTYMK